MRVNSRSISTIMVGVMRSLSMSMSTSMIDEVKRFVVVVVGGSCGGVGAPP